MSIDGWHSAIQHLKSAYKDESIVSNIATANYDEDVLDEEVTMELMNVDENMSFRSFIPMLYDKYEVSHTQLYLQFDTTLPGVIDVASIQEDESEMNPQDGSKLLLELSELVEKPTDELHVDLADDMVHATEALSKCGGSDSETEGESVIMNVWNEDYEGNPDPKIFDKLLKAKHLPRNIDPYVLGKIKRAQIIKQIKDLEEDDSSQGSCAMMLNRMCMPTFYDAGEFTDEGSLVTMETSSIMESVKESSIVGSIDSEDFQFKRPKRSQYALIPDKQFQPGVPPEQLVLMLPKNRRDLCHVPIQKANYEADDDDSSSEERRTYTEHEMEFTLRKYDRTPHRIAHFALSGQIPNYGSYDNDASSLGQSMSMEIEEEIVDLDKCILVRKRIIGDEDPIEGDRSVVSELQTETDAPPPAREPVRKSPLTSLVEIFTDPNFRLQNPEVIDLDRSESERPDASTIENEEEPKEFNASNELVPGPFESDQTNRAEIKHSDDVSVSDHSKSQVLNSSFDILSESDDLNNEKSEGSISYDESESGVSVSDQESSGHSSEESCSLVADNFNCISKATRVRSAVFEPEDGVLDISKATRVQSAASESEDRKGLSVESSSTNDSGLDGAPTSSSVTEGDGLSLNPVGSSYSFYNNQENCICTMNVENELKKGKGFDESCDELDPVEKAEQLFVQRQSLVPQSLHKNNCAGDNDSTASPRSNVLSDCCDSVVPKRSDDDDLSQTSTNDGVDDLIEALDMTLTLQITNTASYSTADGEEMVIAKTVEGIMVEQPNSVYGRIITPEEFEKLQESLCNSLEKIPEDDIEDVSSLGGEVGGEDIDMTDINKSIESEKMSSSNELESMKSDDCTSHSDSEETISEGASVDEEDQSIESDADTLYESESDKHLAQPNVDSSAHLAQCTIGSAVESDSDGNETGNEFESNLSADSSAAMTTTVESLSNFAEVKSDASHSPARDLQIDILSDESNESNDEELSERQTYALNTPAYSDIDAFFDVDATPSPTAEKREACAIKDGLSEDIKVAQLRDESFMTVDESPQKSEAVQKHGNFELDSMIDHLRDDAFMHAVDGTCSEHSEPSMNSKVNMEAADDTCSELSMPRIKSLAALVVMDPSDDNCNEDSIPRINSQIDSASGIASVTPPTKKKLSRSTSKAIANSTSTASNKAKTMTKKRKSSQVPRTSPKKQPDTTIVDDLKTLRKMMAKKNSGRVISRVPSTSLLDSSLLDSLVDLRKKSSSKQLAELKKSLRL